MNSYDGSVSLYFTDSSLIYINHGKQSSGYNLKFAEDLLSSIHFEDLSNERIFLLAKHNLIMASLSPFEIIECLEFPYLNRIVTDGKARLLSKQKSCRFVEQL